MTDPNLPALPIATASLSIKCKKDGSHYALVTVFIPGHPPFFRSYPVPSVTDEVISAALRSVKIPVAWVQGELLPGGASGIPCIPPAPVVINDLSQTKINTGEI